MLQQINKEHILFLDIETVPLHPDLSSAGDEEINLWNKKAKWLVKDDETSESIYPRAGIYAEFGKIVCISAGFFSGNRFRLKSFYGDDEKILLADFFQTLEKFCKSPAHRLCAHNGKEFDFPFLARRCIINGLNLPEALNSFGKKPWEVNHLDTMELWKFGDYKAFTSLQILAHVLQIPTPKDDIDGSMVWHVYWIEKNIERIVTYCQKDVVTIARIFQRLRGEKILIDAEVDNS